MFCFLFRFLSFSVGVTPSVGRVLTAKGGSVTKDESRRHLSISLLLSPPFNNFGLWIVFRLCVFAPHNYSNIKTVLIAAHLNAGIILVGTVYVRYII